MPSRRALPAVLFLLVVPPLLAADYRVTVPAADVPRAGLVVELELPADVDVDAAHVLRDAEGRILPLQRSGGGRPASFVVAEVAAGEEPVFTLEPAGHASGTTRVAASLVQREDGALSFQFAGNPVPLLTYWTTEQPRPRPDIGPLYSRGGFIHPVTTPAGVRVTESYATGHPHQHGVWSPWTKTRFQDRTPDFWNMGQGTGKVEVVGVDQSWVGAVHSGLVAHHRFVDLSAPEPVVALNEQWVLTVFSPNAHAARPAHVFDLEITQTCATKDPLILPEYRYGGLGYRGHEQWNGADRAFFLTSEGVTDRNQAHGTRARWCHIGGVVEGQLAGTAVLGHPANFRAPQPMRVHPKEPFVCFAPSQLGDWQIEPGKPYVARYRFVVMDGAPDAELIDAYWNAYAHPARAQVEALPEAESVRSP